jgi:hypothetical protein
MRFLSSSSRRAVDRARTATATSTRSSAVDSAGGAPRRWSAACGRTWCGRPIARRGSATIAARPARFRELLAELTPEEQRDGAIARIESARAHLREHPASCSARERREDAFADLYEVMFRDFGETRRAVDARWRTLEDHVLAELEYTTSRTCCWNRSTAAMHEIVLAHAEHEREEAAARRECAAPTPFRAEPEDRLAGGDGYDRWRAYAHLIDRGDEWREWS